jgi:CHAT domain-containing protein/tetratricopeptide (TPR) repeat protein
MSKRAATPMPSRSLSALSIVEKAHGPEHPDVGGILINLAVVARAQGRYPEAEQLYKRAHSTIEKALGPEHPTFATSLSNEAGMFLAQGRYAEAEQAFRRALVIREKTLGPDHFDVGGSLNNLAALAFARQDWANAADFWRRSTSVLARRARRGTSDLGQALIGNRKNDAERSSWQFKALVKVVYRVARDRRNDEPALLREMFQTAQWAQASEAATSMAQMAARHVKGDGALARLVRERQDLIGEWQGRDAARTAAIAQASDKRDRAMEETNVRRLAVIDARVAEIDARLTTDFPDYAAFASPAPMSVEEVQAALGASEALVLILDTPAMPPTSEETHIWVVTKTETRWVRTDAGTKALTDFVVALRCGLDYIGWSGPRCFELLHKVYAGDDFNAGRPLPFDLARAYGLYKALFGQVEKLIRGKQLLLVTAGPMTQLPPHVLVTEPSASGDLKSAAWLIRSHATTVLPAVSSLKALRRVVRASAAASPLIGFGNPLLDGPNSRYADSARRARETERCPDTRRQQNALFEPRRGVSPITTRGLTDLASLKRQIPLPETADELCSVARDVGADIGEVRLGTRATEREIKALSASGALARYRIIHFATHAATAGQLAGTAQPGMIFTPPDKATEEDDGYLTASEVAALKLDADWVILSACNTAAGAATEAEALSGLARAFFYAQARALLVSHWEVNSEATVALITKTFAELKAEPSIGRAEALRRAMLNLIANDKALSAHPANWAPFVLVGEGAR